MKSDEATDEQVDVEQLHKAVVVQQPFLVAIALSAIAKNIG